MRWSGSTAAYEKLRRRGQAKTFGRLKADHAADICTDQANALLQTHTRFCHYSRDMNHSCARIEETVLIRNRETGIYAARARAAIFGKISSEFVE